MPILREHGLFWWCDEAVADGDYAPKNHVSGVLEINDDGKAVLDLTGSLTRGGPMREFFRTFKSQKKCLAIQGILKESASYVLLPAPYRDGGRVLSKGISHELYASLTCIISSEFIPAQLEKVYDLNVLLENLDDWIGESSITVSKKGKSVKANYRAPTISRYQLNECILELSHELEAPWAPSHVREVLLREHTRISIKTRKPEKYEWVEESHGRITDLLSLLVGTQVFLDWPTIKLGTKKQACKYYYARASGSTKKLNFHELTVPFSLIKDDFGILYQNWQNKRDLYGPGFYLFLSIMRGNKTYIENKFVNLIWGLESLHRKHTVIPTNIKMEEKIQEIIKAVPSKHKKWLSYQLKHAGEPSLRERLESLFKELPIAFDEKELITFSTQCANRRNDISHFGGIRGERNYDEFISELYSLTNALFYLYYALILQRTGIKDGLVANWLTVGYKSSQIKNMFTAAGLKTFAPVSAIQ